MKPARRFLVPSLFVALVLGQAHAAVADSPIESTGIGADSALTLQEDFGACAFVDFGASGTYTVVFTVKGQTSTSESQVAFNHRGGGVFSDPTYQECLPGGLEEFDFGDIAAEVTAYTSAGDVLTNSRMLCHKVGPGPATCIPRSLWKSDLSLMIDGPAQVVSGGPAHYTVTIDNGDIRASGISFTDTLAPLAESVEASSSQGTCSVQEGPPVTNGEEEYRSHIVSCDLGALPPGGTATVSLTVTPIWIGPYPQAASVVANGPDEDARDNQGSFVTFVNPPGSEEPPPED